MDKKTRDTFVFSITGQMEEEFLQEQWLRQSRISETSIRGQFEKDFLEDQRIGRPMDRKTKNSSPSFLLQDSCEKISWKTSG